MSSRTAPSPWHRPIVGGVKPTLAQRPGSYVRHLRLERGLTQVESAERCGFYQTYQRRIETGRANPSLNAIEVVAATPKMDVFELFETVCVHKVSPPSACRGDLPRFFGPLTSGKMALPPLRFLNKSFSSPFLKTIDLLWALKPQKAYDSLDPLR